MSIKAIIFDLYGTLITRQERVFLREISKYYMKTLGEGTTLSQLGTFGLEIIKRLMVFDLSTQSLPPEVLSTFSAPGIHDPAELEQAFREALTVEARATKILPGVKRILAFFQARGYRFGLVSNASTYHKQPFYDFDLARFFDAAVFSCDVGYAKPDPEIYLLACRQLGVSPEDVLFVGDSYNMDVDIPLRLGMQALHISKSDRYAHHIDTIASMGLVLMENGLQSIPHQLKTASALVEREIQLNTFTLISNHHDRQCLTYICSGFHSDAPCHFFLHRFLSPSSFPLYQQNHAGSIPVNAGSETVLLTPYLAVKPEFTR